MNTWDSHVMGVWFDGLPMAVFHRNPSIYFMVTSAFILNWTISLAAEIREDFAKGSFQKKNTEKRVKMDFWVGGYLTCFTFQSRKRL